MASRLDRLFVLLESGSSPVTRKAAASQLGEVQRLHPHELHNLLKTVLSYLKSSSWDTRIAAGWAVEAILKQVPQWDPVGCPDVGEINGIPGSPELQGRLTCENFNAASILESSAQLMGSEGKEYEVADICSGNSAVSLEKQKQLLNQKLNLDTVARLGFDTNSLYSAEDFKVEILPSSDGAQKRSVREVVGLSCREVNRAKRKARQAASLLRQKSRDKTSSSSQHHQLQQSDEEDEPEKKKLKTEISTDEDLCQVPVPDNTNSWPSNVVDWPLDWFCSQLTEGLFAAGWEVRHGSGTALKHLIKTHGKAGGKSARLHLSQMNAAHERWLVDIALRLICVLTLDRFGDFVFDQVVAPVRETCAQSLGSVIHFMDKCSVKDIMKVLLQLLDLKDWETRHGGLLGIKYIFAVRQDLLVDLLPDCFERLESCLRDPVDDVGAAAGGALQTCADLMAERFPAQALAVLHALCSLIPELDDLTPASNTFVPLLAKFLLKPHISELIGADTAVPELISRIWSLLQHNSTSVREAALKALASLVGHPSFASLLQPTLRHLFQRALFEHDQPTHANVEVVWRRVLEGSQLKDILHAACPCIPAWLCLAMQPSRLPFDPNVLLHPKPLSKETPIIHHKQSKSKVSSEVEPPAAPRSDMKQYLGGNETIPANLREENAAHARLTAAKMLGFLSGYIVQPAPDIVYTPGMESPIDCYVNVLITHLSNRSALQRYLVGLVVSEWARLRPPSPPPPLLVAKLLDCLNETIYYDEIALTYSRLLQDMKDYLSLVKHYKVPIPGDTISISVFTLEQMDHLCSSVIPNSLSACKVKPKVLETLQERRKTISNSVTNTINDQNTFHIMTQAALAGAVVMLHSLPEKLNPVCKPLMESLKKEENEELQILSAHHLAELIKHCVNRNPCPNPKIISNLITFLRSDTEFTPRISTEKEYSSSIYNIPAQYCNIITLAKQLKTAERAVLRRSTSGSGRGPGRPPTVNVVDIEELIKEDNARKVYIVQRRGATIALEVITRTFGSGLPSALPTLWQAIIGDLLNKVVPANNVNGSVKFPQSVEDAEYIIGILQVLEVTCASVDKSLLPQVMSCDKRLIQLLSADWPEVRHMSARCLAALAALDTSHLLEQLVDLVLPLLSSAGDETKRRGAIEVITLTIERLKLSVVPYIYFLVVPLMGRMSDQCPDIRSLATQTFAELIQVMPLDGAVPNPPRQSVRMERLKTEQKAFLEQLFNPALIPDYKVPVPIRAELRSYQQAGINWLAFLNRYKLHGLLCDDMGLGKTLQSICILAGDHYHRQQTYKESRRADCYPLPSLVVCPPTLTGHWVYEVEKFISSKYLSPLQYAGPPAERERLRTQVKRHNLIVASYDIVRKDIDFFSSIKWNYCILDEGHVIKNCKTKSSKAIKELKANHRLILSGTPIQNNVLELWSLFDWLMPGFLGTEKQFTARYSRPILSSRDPKSSPKEQEAGVLAMEALHRQVLPFVLRRMKEDVLKDLPPKITQDYYCELSPLQKLLYEDFAKSKAHQALSESVDSPQASNMSHIFQALRYLQSVCNHPKLALNPKHPQYEKIIHDLHQQKSSLSDINHAAKFPALKQLLIDCGIGAPVSCEPTDDLTVNQHRALIFCQLKAMLDILENDFFKVHLPGVSYLRLDGSVPANMRHAVVTRFNSDPTIEVLILTTQVGGLGLNLTGADTVIFIEHDWSPMKDLQAMDRAHRIGQKKVVNVYRLITRNTLEEKIMGLQKFKLMTANTVISAENASLETMGTEKLLDLFSLEGGSGGGAGSSGLQRSSTSTSGGSSSSGGGSRHFLESLPELWELSDYTEEYDLSNFLENLNA